MALLLMRSGKQILRFASSSAAVAKSQQRLGGVSAAASRIQTFRFSTAYKPKKEDNDFELPPTTFRSIFTYLFMTPPSPHTPFRDLLGKFMNLAEISTHYSEDRLPSILDDIRPVLNELLYRMSKESVTRIVYEFARPTASSSLIVLDRKIKSMVDELPSHVIHLFQDMLIDMIKATYKGGSYGVSFDSNSKSFVLTADVSSIAKEYFKLFVVKDYLMVTGIDKDAPRPASPQLLALNATIHNILKMPSCLYSRDELTASILEDGQLKIVVPKTEVLVDNPRVFQLDLDTKGTHQG